jgi:acetyl esterase/lipase
MKFCFAILGIALSAAIADADEGGRSKYVPQFPLDVRVERGVAFLSPDREERADLYFPLQTSGAGKLPAVIIIHGGGWVGGHREAAREINIGGTLARNGYVAMSIDYALSQKKQAVWPTNLWDCKTAVRWLRKNAARLGIDPNRIGVVGGSAGGHLAAMIALTTPGDGLDPAGPDADISCAVSCCVDMYGIAELGSYHDVTMLGKKFADAPQLYQQASPITYIRSNSPPFLILHGTADTTVKLEQSQLLATRLALAGVPHELLIVPGAKHTFDLQPPQKDLRPEFLGFLDKHLRAPK